MEAPHVEGELSLREVQLASLNILKRIDAICRTEDIRYWVMYGSLIGAVRHHGFIPWDDDLDIAMPRSDYNRFLSYCRARSEELRPLVALYGNGERKLPFLLTRVSDTTYKMIGEYGDEVSELGAFVDVYPIDGLGDDKSEALAYKSYCVDSLMSYLRAGDFKANNRGNGTIKQALKAVRATMMGSADRRADEMHELATRYPYESSTYVGCIEWGFGRDQVWRREAFDSLKNVPFEDMMVPIPSGYDEVLRLEFGDYMSYPPEKDRIPHHFYSIVKRLSLND